MPSQTKIRGILETIRRRGAEGTVIWPRRVTISVHPGADRATSVLMSKRKLPYLHETKLTVRQGQQAWHLSRALAENDETDVLAEVAAAFVDVGRVQTLSEGIVLAGAMVTALRSAEAGERIPQKARERLSGKRRRQLSVTTVTG